MVIPKLGNKLEFAEYFDALKAFSDFKSIVQYVSLWLEYRGLLIE